METLILMTGTYRLDNLLKIAKSINKYYDEYISKFNIIWLITIDQTHAIGNIENTIEYLKQNMVCLFPLHNQQSFQLHQYYYNMCYLIQHM